MSYQFKRYMSSLKTGRDYSAGTQVPELLINNPASLAALLASGDIELVVDAPVPVLVDELIDEPLELPVEEIRSTKKKAKK